MPGSFVGLRDARVVTSLTTMNGVLSHVAVAKVGSAPTCRERAADVYTAAGAESGGRGVCGALHTVRRRQSQAWTRRLWSTR